MFELDINVFECLCAACTKDTLSFSLFLISSKEMEYWAKLKGTCDIYVCICSWFFYLVLFYIFFCCRWKNDSQCFIYSQTQWNPLYGIFFIVQMQCTMCNLYVFCWKIKANSQTNGTVVSVFWVHWMPFQSFPTRALLHLLKFSRIPFRNNWLEMRFNPEMTKSRAHNLVTFSQRHFLYSIWVAFTLFWIENDEWAWFECRFIAELMITKLLLKIFFAIFLSIFLLVKKMTQVRMSEKVFLINI